MLNVLFILLYIFVRAGDTRRTAFEIYLWVQGSDLEYLSFASVNAERDGLGDGMRNRGEEHAGHALQRDARGAAQQ
jgi:hypothetical protein